MSLQTARERRNLTQQGLADVLSLKSKGTISGLERGRKNCSIKLALRIESLFDGEVSALGLLSDDDATLLRDALRRARRELEPAA